MSGSDGTREAAALYVRENFAPQDRLAVVLLNRHTNSVIQRIATAERIAAPDFQAWLRYENARRHEIYLSMNAVADGAKGRTKADIATIRHLYLDFDENGTVAVEALLKRAELPKPNYLINTSPGKWQVVWRVDGFGKEQAEACQRALVREHAADPAATDCARVLRLPGFYNHKYGKPYLIRAEALATEIYRPEQFPSIAGTERPGAPVTRARRPSITGRAHYSQSERDWAYAKRALARGEIPALVVAAIASYRRFDKHNPQYYAELTVRKAGESLKVETAYNPEPPART
jgi:hypothetical protein